MKKKISLFISCILMVGLILVLMPVQPTMAIPSELFFSEYAEGNGFNKAVEIYNGTGASVNLSTYTLELYSNGSATASKSMALSGTLADGGVYVIAHQDAADSLTTVADLLDTPNNVINFNGDDAIVLKNGGVVVDAIGQTGFDPGSEWGSGDASTKDNTIRRKSTVCAGEIDASDPYDPTTEWDGYANNTHDGFGSHTANCNGGGGPSTPVIVINEIMQNPSAVSDSNGEWFELYNGDSNAVDIDGWTVQDNDFDSFVINNGGPLVIPAGGYLVLGNNANSGTNGGVTVNYQYAGMFLSNGADELVLLDGSLAEVDRVEYDGGTAFPDPTGASMSLEDSTSDNNVGANWCQSTTPFGAGDLGTPGEVNTCEAPIVEVKIHEVQGNGAASPLVGQTVAIEGIVVGDFQDDVGTNGDLNGFFVQEEDADADADQATSEGVFVFQGSNPSVDVAIGDHVRVEGPVSEYFGDTQITSSSGVTVNSSGNPLPAASVLSLPVAAISDFEAYEGMYVTFPQALVISEYFNFDRFGEIVLTDARHFQPTAVFEPGSVDAANLALANSLARITLDDGLTSQNPNTTIHPNGIPFDLTNLFRGGDTVTNVTGVINYSFGLYRVQPTQGANYTSVNARTASSDPVGGNVTVASFNVLNYFTTLDYSSGHPLDNTCGPLENQGCRGADANQPDEFTRQRAKIIAALAAIDADVVGLIEIENHPTDVPLADLVSGLNAEMGAGTYAYVATGPVGPDVIRVAFIYKPAAVTPFGSHAVLDTPAFLDPNNLGDDKNRAALAQTFSVNSTGGVFTAVVNHLKSKGSPCGPGDDDPEQASCNLTRTLAAQELLSWLATDPTGSADEDFMIIGDLNAYDKEDPIDVLTAGGYTDLAYQYQGEYAYSYVFSGQWGYLDYALANAALQNEVTGATEWHINADEADLIDYDTSFKSPGQDAIYAPDAYRASDHDPVIVGMELTTEAEIYELIESVQKLEDDGTLNRGQANAFTRKLENTLAKLANGSTNAAANQLGAFINQVEDFVNEGILTADQGDQLIKSAAVLVDTLNN